MTTPHPRSVAWLGYGGLIPFVMLTIAFLLDHHHSLLWSDALIGYGAVILSFVGALHWAFAMSLPDLTEQQRTARFVWSVVPALLAWPALLVDATMANFLLVPGFVAHYLQDRRLARSQTLPDWYLPLRFRLTSVACLCLSVVGVLSFGRI
jgi:hypothetical protein